MEIYCDDVNWNYHYNALNAIVDGKTALAGGEFAAVLLGDNEMIAASRLDGKQEWIITRNDQETTCEGGMPNDEVAPAFEAILATGWRGVVQVEKMSGTLWQRMYATVQDNIYHYGDDED